MKKTCYGCRALESVGSCGCYLGFSNQAIYNNKTGSRIDIKPLEECPKPKTLNDYITLQLKPC